ncbi:MAG: chaperonin GroEL [Planctomycetes bacterium]|nr:chaperonin GroEL [Planctomycetota bacterium]
MAKKLTFKEESREAIRNGVRKLAQAVKSTLGPAGRSAVLDRSWGEPKVTRDGSTVAEDIDLSDKTENVGARLLRQAADKTGDQAGDGSTTSTVLAEAIFEEGLKRVVAGANPMLLVRGIRAACDRVAGALKDASRPVKDEEIVTIATIAANQDREIGRMIADAMAKVGREGVITVEEGKEIETKVDVVQGMEFDRGFLSPHFVTDPETMTCELEDPYILIHEEKISNLNLILPVMELVAKTRKPLLVISEDVESEALAGLVVNNLRKVLPCAAVKAPAYGDRRKAMLEDIAILTGGTAIMKELGLEPESIAIKHLGRAKKVEITSEKTTISRGAGSAAAVKARAEQLRKELADATSDYDREKLQERIAKLVGGVAEIRVGAATETDMKEKKVRAESALHATRAAVEEGILPGGGVAYIRAVRVLADLTPHDAEEAEGVGIVRKALYAPFRQLLRNAEVEPAIVLREIEKSRKASVGYDVVRREVGDLYEFGVVDAAKVARLALQNATSVATLLLTTEAVITELPKEKDPAKGRAGMGPGHDFE